MARSAGLVSIQPPHRVDPAGLSPAADEICGGPVMWAMDRCPSAMRCSTALRGLLVIDGDEGRVRHRELAVHHHDGQSFGGRAIRSPPRFPATR